jgi:predicted kinase
MNQKKVIIINGPSGVGKSTISHIISRDIKKGVHIDVDILRHLVANHRLTHAQVHLAYRNAAALANNFINHGYTVIVDGVFPNGNDLALFCRTLKNPRASIYVFTLSGELPVLQQREAMKMGSDSYSRRVQKLHRAMKAEASRLGVMVDTTDLGIMQTVARIKDLIARDVGKLTDGFCSENRKSATTTRKPRH